MESNGMACPASRIYVIFNFSQPNWPWECSSNCQTTSMFIYIATPLDPNANWHEVTGQLRHFSCHEMGEILPGWGEIKSKHSGTWRGAVNLMRFSKIKVAADCGKK